jgi:diaminopropionate ammonia-lyase
MTSLVNPGRAPAAVPRASAAAWGFHQRLADYRPTPIRGLPALADELGVAAVTVKDESNRLGLPSFKVLGASWAVECALRAERDVHTLVAASAGNHGRAVAHLASPRGLRCRVYLPANAARARREAIEAEGADTVVVEGGYEDAVAEAARAARGAGIVAIADVGTSPSAGWAIDGYATLFVEAAAQAAFDLMLVPVGVGSLAAAAARFAAPAGIHVVGVEPATAACLTASLAAGAPTRVETPGTSMAGLDCAELSARAWPSLRAGIAGTVTVQDGDVHAAMRSLAAEGLAIGDCGAAPVAALRRLAAGPEGAALRAALGLGTGTRVLVVASEGPTDPEAYHATVGH